MCYKLRRSFLVILLVLFAPFAFCSSTEERLKTNLNQLIQLNNELLMTLDEQSKALEKAENSMKELENSLNALQAYSKKQDSYLKIAKVVTPIAIVISFVGGAYVGYKLTKD